MLHVRLDRGISKLSTDQTLGIEDGILRVHGNLVLGGITDQSLSTREGNIGRGGTLSLVVGDDFDTIVLPDTDTRIGGTQINSN